MSPTPEQAYALVCDYNEGEFHRKHARIEMCIRDSAATLESTPPLMATRTFSAIQSTFPLAFMAASVLSNRVSLSLIHIWCGKSHR